MMPETFSFGLEPREEPEAETVQKSRGGDAEERGCQHVWIKAPEEKQTVKVENKVVWCCRFCGELAITYAWKNPK